MHSSSGHSYSDNNGSLGVLTFLTTKYILFLVTLESVRVIDHQLTSGHLATFYNQVSFVHISCSSTCMNSSGCRLAAGLQRKAA